MAIGHPKKWLGLPKSATHAILYVLVLMPQNVIEAKLCLLSYNSVTGDFQLQQFCLQLHLGEGYLQTQAFDYCILSEAHSQLSSFPVAHPLYFLRGCWQLTNAFVVRTT